ncbi:hypothetical protein [Gordonia soli]|uniref:Uncharacterized protein n=1 Tax=Gordonia soli NBRC 108243 TaxID=1223545 RepID=M0QR94_9ACTN|nr:hypothetical protein [Gordonia soli]GAC70816.1 hypothetical protein GS4_41_00650 [Gordonia soli NBRC 108243]
MARDHARIYVDIWGDDDWLDLSIDAQLLYLTLYTSATLSLCGAGDWHAGRLSGRARDWTRERVSAAAAELSRGLFVVIDEDTDEFLIRSWIKHDGLWRTPNMAVSVVNARSQLASRSLRGVVVFEVLKLREGDPTSTSWEKPAVAKMLTQKAINPAELEPFNPDPNGGPNGGSNGGSNPSSNPYDSLPLTHGVNPGSNGGPTTATAITTATTTSSLSPETDGVGLERESIPDQYPMIPIPDDWSPNDLHRAKWPRLDVDAEAEAFKDHQTASGRLCNRRAGWDAAFNGWLRRAAGSAQQKPGTSKADIWDASVIDPADATATAQRRLS